MPPGPPARRGLRGGRLHARHPGFSYSRPLKPSVATCSSRPPQAQQQPLHSVFRTIPDLELIKYNIPVYLATQGDAAFAH